MNCIIYLLQEIKHAIITEEKVISKNQTLHFQNYKIFVSFKNCFSVYGLKMGEII